MTEFIEVKTADLTGEALNWAVSQDMGTKAEVLRGGRYGEPDSRWFVARAVSGERLNWVEDWALTGPLLDKFAIEFEWVTDATIRAEAIIADHGVGFGPRHLVAACRAVVSGKLGDVTLVPVELVGP